MTSDLSHSGSSFKWIYSLICLTVNGFLCLLFLPNQSSAEPFVPQWEDNSKETLLLVWVHPFGARINIPDCWERLGMRGCKVTDDRSRYTQADAVLIHHRDICCGGTHLPPKPRPPGQKWIWFNFESPTHAPQLWKYEGIYNLTLSYREDSDVAMPYGCLIQNALVNKVPFGHYAVPLGGSSASPTELHRPHLVAWVVSNWSESHARVAFYKLLKQHIQVDVFGAAGRPLSHDGTVLVDLIKQYRFYLAFENSQHTDYITEKLWNAVRGGAIPVVLGPSRKNYERFLPPEAFIHVDDFPTAQDLAQYLLKVKDSPSLIEKHLSWRKNYSLYRSSWCTDHYCTACMAAKRRKGKVDVVKNLNEWFLS
ncbi:alpha-(1,3)-fucosyltransferase 9-like [Salarias fasciatus]|uniref:alpha-(1,3)-fucosyltransferase 9-like n=1 Tax=Salarias fasciatus TaxID=181472 RepID=UPI0011770AF7|nr:alpha-(1,3)-fucosyltransferase 9-like [Salarias fasciatus]